MEIREFRDHDAEAISRLIQNNLIEINSQDYDSRVIDYMCKLFTPEYLKGISDIRKMFVAEEQGDVIGTVGLEGNEVCALYVTPVFHGQGIGKQLLKQVEKFALAQDIHSLQLSASLTAVHFYEKMGYMAQGKEDSELFGPAFAMVKVL